MSSEIANEIKILKNKVSGKFEQTMGLRIWGLDIAGNPVAVLVDSDGKLIVSDESTVTADVSDRAGRLLGVVYGSQGQKLQQKASTYELEVDLKSLSYGTLPVNEQTPWNPPNLDVALSGIKTQTDKLTFEAITNKLLVKETRDWTITETVTITPDPRDRSWTLGDLDIPDLKDRAGRLVGIIYGSQSQQLLQRATSYDLQVQLRTGGSEYDARQIRTLTASDIVSAVQSGTWSIGRTWTLSSITDSISAIQSGVWSTGRTWNLGASDVPDLSDRATRLLGIAYGSQSQQLLQRAITYDLQVQLRTGGTEYDAREIRTLTSTDVVSVNNFANPLPVSQSGTWNIGTVTTLTGITNPISATQSGVWNIGTVTTLTGITNPISAAQSGTWNVSTVTTLTGITNALPTGTNVIGAITQSGTWNIGTVTTLTGITNALPTGTNWLGKIQIGDTTYTLTVPQAGDSIGRGVFLYGSDYEAVPTAKVAKVDSSGRLSCVLG